MKFNQVSMCNVRLVRRADILLGAGLNVVWGNNGAGKSSFLEGVGLLGLGRSFRTARHSEVTSHGERTVTVYARGSNKTGDIAVGVSRGREGSRAKINGLAVANRSSLARSVPMVAVDSVVFGMLQGGSAVRRRLFDWIVFHVEPEFGAAVAKFDRIKRQRNLCLRTGLGASDVTAWDDGYLQYGLAISAMRQRVADGLVANLGTYVGESTFQGCRFVYESGWRSPLTREAAGERLRSAVQSDRKRGYTTVGCQFGDWSLRLRHKNVARFVSRGEGKKLGLAVVFALVKMWRDRMDDSPILLVDDLAAELDSKSLSQIVAAMERLQGQSLVSCVVPDGLVDFCTTKPDLFHVEHGEISPVL